jgi:hypothetical protein
VLYPEHFDLRPFGRVVVEVAVQVQEASPAQQLRSTKCCSHLARLVDPQESGIRTAAADRTLRSSCLLGAHRSQTALFGSKAAARS